MKEKNRRDRLSKALLKVKNVMDKNRWSHGCYSSFKHGERFFTSFLGFFGNFFFVWPDFTKVEHFLNENMENISIMSKTFPE